MKKKITKRIKKHRWDILADIIIQNQFRVIAEIGASKGDNARGIIKSLGDRLYFLHRHYLVDLPPLLQEDRYKFNDKNLKHCRLLTEGSISSTRFVDDNELDLIFIDGDTSSAESIGHDIEAWYPKIKDDGIISGRYWNTDQVNYQTPLLASFFGLVNINTEPLIEKCSGQQDYLWWVRK